MKKNFLLGCIFFILCSLTPGQASVLDLLKSTLGQTLQTASSSGKIDLGLKEALQIGITNAVNYLGKKDGYFANAAVKILLPEEIRKAEKVLRGVGLGPQLDEFTLSMNRAAEKAAPLAADIFSDAITEMSFDDADRILRGGNTATTDYLRNKTYDKLLTLFEPAVRQAMCDYEVTRQYDAIAAKLQALPLVGKTIDLNVNRYVSSKALDGLFTVLAAEETKIRTDPQARVTDLLKEVFK